MPPPDPKVAASRAGSQTQLHNFSFPILKKWGNQRVLRCLSVNRNGETIGNGRRPDVVRPRIRAPGEEVEGRGDEKELDEVKAKLLIHLREAADRLKLVVPPGDGELVATPESNEDMVPQPAPEALYSAVDAVVPWNLRRRRRGSSRSPIWIERTASLSPPAERSNGTRNVRLRSEDVGRRERPKFSNTLSRDEIEEDVYAFTGSLPRRRPRRRARILQNQLDSLFPGSWLSEITTDSYKVAK